MDAAARGEAGRGTLTLTGGTTCAGFARLNPHALGAACVASGAATAAEAVIPVTASRVKNLRIELSLIPNMILTCRPVYSLTRYKRFSRRRKDENLSQSRRLGHVDAFAGFACFYMA